MKINRQNYEHWFIDFFEGNLNPDDEAMVRDFIALNPDLDSEFESLSEFELIPEQTKFHDKDLLKQNQFKAINGITKFERLSIAYLENELNANEQKELDRILLNSAKKKAEFHLLQKTKIIAENGIVYTNKNSLKKLFIVQVNSKYRFIYQAAAVLVLLMGLTFLFNRIDDASLTGKKMRNHNIMPVLNKKLQIKEMNIAHNKEYIKIVVVQNPKEENEIRKEILPLNKIVANKCDKVKTENTYVDSEQFVSSVYNNVYAQNSTYNGEEMIFENRVREKINTTRKSLFAKTKDFVKKQFKYKKTYSDDGRMLIAFNIGDYQYKINKKQKSTN